MPSRRSFLSLVLAAGFAACRKKRTVPRSGIAVPPGWNETGVASWYGNPYHGRRAADGSVYDMEQMTAAHRTLAFGTRVRIARLDNGRSVEVRITDRGPFIEGRIIDLSRAAARALDMLGPGIARVRITALASGPRELGESAFAVQAGAFRDKGRAERLRRSLRDVGEPVVLARRDGDPPQWRVLVGRKATFEEAGALAERLRPRTRSAFVVRLDEDDDESAPRHNR